MTNAAVDGGPQALVLSCPTDDLASVRTLLEQGPVALVPSGGVGDLGLAAGVELLLIVEIDDDGPRSAITWQARLGDLTPLQPDPARLLPESWLRRHPDAYLRTRTPGARAAPTRDEHWDEEDEPADRPAQVFLPVTELQALPQAHWVFTNELVPKQRREGRRFAPRVPTLVTLPTDT